MGELYVQKDYLLAQTPCIQEPSWGLDLNCFRFCNVDPGGFALSSSLINNLSCWCIFCTCNLSAKIWKFALSGEKLPLALRLALALSPSVQEGCRLGSKSRLLEAAVVREGGNCVWALRVWSKAHWSHCVRFLLQKDRVESFAPRGCHCLGLNSKLFTSTSVFRSLQIATEVNF